MSSPDAPSAPRLPAVVQGYNPSIDYMRLVAALLIVQFHAGGPLRMFGQASVGFFVIVMIWFTLAGLKRPKLDYVGYTTQRAGRLMYPFVIWAGLHLLAKAVSVSFDPGLILREVRAYVPPAGSFAQLWFLPWAVVLSAGLGAAFWRRDVHITGMGAAMGGSVLCALVSLVCLSIWTFLDVPLLAGLSILYLPSAAAGILLFALRDRSDLLLAASGLLVAFAIAMDLGGLDGASQIYIAVPVTIAALLFAAPGFSWTRRTGTMAMDIYLCHILVIAVVTRFAGVDVTTFTGSVLACLCAFGVALVMQIGPVGRWLR